jgi:hypothetical protein
MFERAIALDAAIAPAYSWLAVLELRKWWASRSPVNYLQRIDGIE